MRLHRLVPALLLLAGCGGTAAGDGPPEVRWGVEPCSFCRMAVGEPGHAAAARGPDGAEARFDDPACLVAFLAEHPGEAWRSWVGDQAGSGWVRAEDALYVRAPSHLTPMGSGLLAFRSLPDAEAAAAAHGTRVLAWSELKRSGVGDQPGLLTDRLPQDSARS